MAVLLDNISIQDVAVADDSEDARNSMSDELKDFNLTPRPLQGPFKGTDQLVNLARSVAQAAVCDHHLRTRNFADFSGAEAVARSYEMKFPAVLVTSWSKADIDQIRFYRRKVPVLLTPEQADPDSIVRGFEVCIREFKNDFLPNRKPWKTLIRIEAVDDQEANPLVYVVIPGWNATEVIRFPKHIIPESLHPHVKPEERFFALVNKGADDQADLYFEEFEYRGR